jgi:predicted nucleotidyltransferase
VKKPQIAVRESTVQNHRQQTTTSAAAARALEEVRRLVLEVIGTKRAAVYLFGSWARGQATRLSDIDVAIDPYTTLPRGTLSRLRERLEESQVPYHVDVVDLTRATPEFRRRVLAEGVLWSD